MRFLFVAQSIVLLVVLSAAGCGNVTSLSSGQSSPAVPEQGIKALSTVTCESEEQRGYFESFVGEDVPGGPTTPSHALADLLSAEGKRMGAGSFQIVAANDRAAQIAAERDGARVFSAFVEKHGDSWYVTEFVACSKFLSSLNSGQS